MSDVFSNKNEQKIEGEYTVRHDGDFFVIRNYDKMRPFFMTIVSANDHWMFISSNGGVSAGRKNPDTALFPYYTDDKITDTADITGSKTIIRKHTASGVKIWEPFNQHLEGFYNTTGNLFKNREGNKLVFQQINHDLELTFEYSWSFSEKYGIVKKTTLFNNSKQKVKLDVLDGIQNILAYGVSSSLQNDRSTLIDAYKTAIWSNERRLAIFALSSMVVDKAEPSEALKSTSVWSVGFDKPSVLLSTLQLPNFRKTGTVENEPQINAEKGAFFLVGEMELAFKESKSWSIVSEINQSIPNLISISKELKNSEELVQKLDSDVWKNKQDLRKKIGLTDGIQLSKDRFGTGRHFSNVLFNIMRGGTFDDQYNIDIQDFLNHIKRMNKKDYAELKPTLNQMPRVTTYHQLRYFLSAARHKNAMRYYLEYLPISFSRRHGDPSRPWNYFSIELKDEKGNKNRNYQGNWRDIFQNWEALAYSYPEFCLGMITKFVNASTIDGYNPYRITKEGVDWEVVDPNDPWSHIGYWGDHQIIYLAKLLEFSFAFHPDRLKSLLTAPLFTYANVPYRIKGYDAIVKDAKNTINYDFGIAKLIENRVQEVGTDGKMVFTDGGQLQMVNLTEKILVTTLTKLYNFIPEAGIWLNTQRPEWNDANNALVGNGVSMVTLYYLRRFLKFATELFLNIEKETIEINKSVIDLMDALERTFLTFKPQLKSGFTDETRKQFMDSFGIAGEHYRTTAYEGFTQDIKNVSPERIRSFFDLARTFLEHSIDANKRSDELYHSYNLINIKSNEVEVTHLYKMLEGQVAILSSKYLNSSKALGILNALKASDMYREDQYSYMLYPDRILPDFLEKNTINLKESEKSYIKAILLDADCDILEQDIEGNIHFNGNFHHSNDVEKALDEISNKSLRKTMQKERLNILALFEKVFEHRSFTGRSGAFYGYEGLGSIYWHMVSKLLLSIQENIKMAQSSLASSDVVGALIAHYYEVRAGIGINKSPELYGAFPTDAYSHTPKHAGAKQPGMTGQVKEDIINRWAELGVEINGGRLGFNPILFRKSEFIDKVSTLSTYSIEGKERKVEVPANAMGFTFCQIPIIYTSGLAFKMTIHFTNGEVKTSDKLKLSRSESKSVFRREGSIDSISLVFTTDTLLN